jgi:AcrR family transcriptional regulator
MTHPRARRPSPARNEKDAINRQALIDAAASLVGEVGYEKASVALITARAGLAHGSFYRHFESRQALFDILLPTLGGRLIEALRTQVAGAGSAYDVEERGFRGLFDFIDRNPGFYRILNEAEIAAPMAFQRHLDALVDHYVHSLERSRERGDLGGYEPRELEVIAYILMAARYYLYLRFGRGEAGPGAIPDWVVGTYLKFVRHGLNAPEGPPVRAPEVPGSV